MAGEPRTLVVRINEDGLIQVDPVQASLYRRLESQQDWFSTIYTWTCRELPSAIGQAGTIGYWLRQLKQKLLAGNKKEAQAATEGLLSAARLTDPALWRCYQSFYTSLVLLLSDIRNWITKEN